MVENWNRSDLPNSDFPQASDEPLNLLSLIGQAPLAASGNGSVDQIAFLAVLPNGPGDAQQPAGNRDLRPNGPGDAQQPAGNRDVPEGARVRPVPQAVALEPAAIVKPPRLRLGIDFEAPAPVAAHLVGNRYLQAAQNGVPLHVRENIERSIDQLRSPDTRAQAQQRLREFGPAAVPFLISQLDSGDFRRRDAAHTQLLQMADAALPGMLSARDGTESMEMRRRLDLLIDQLAPAHNGDVLDAQGRFRRSNSLSGESRSVNYDAQGRVTNVTLDTGSGQETFVRRADGTFDRLNDSVPVRDVSVSTDGSISFRVGDASVLWSRAGNVQVTGAPVTSDLSGGVMTVPVRNGDSTVNVSVLPRRNTATYERK